MTPYLITSTDLFSNAEKTLLSSFYSSIYERAPDLALEVYYSSILERLSKEQKSPAQGILFETGCSLKAQDRQSTQENLYLLTDINGLMLQPACPTKNDRGEVQFTDVSELFDPALILAAETALRDWKGTVRRSIAAAVAAPELLTSSECSILTKMGTEIAITHLYLEARAARARNLPVLGVVVEKGIPAEKILKILTLLSGIGKS